MLLKRRKKRKWQFLLQFMSRGLRKAKEEFLSCDIEMYTKINVGTSVDFFYHHKRKSNVDSQRTLKGYRLVAINLQCNNYKI